MDAAPYPAELALVIAARNGRPGARGELVAAFSPSIGAVARIYRHSQVVQREELMQAGVVGLLRALEKYAPETGTPFWAYASWWVRQAMQQLISELTWPLVLSDRALRQLARVRDARRTFLQRNGCEPGPRQLASATGLSPTQVGRLLAAERRPRSLQEPAGGSTEDAGPLVDLLEDPDAEDDYEQAARRVDSAGVPALLDALDARERDIVRRHYGFAGRELSLRELGGRHGVSAERVRQIEQEALKKLRAAATAA